MSQQQNCHGPTIDRECHGQERVSDEDENIVYITYGDAIGSQGTPSPLGCVEARGILNGLTEGVAAGPDAMDTRLGNLPDLHRDRDRGITLRPERNESKVASDSDPGPEDNTAVSRMEPGIAIAAPDATMISSDATAAGFSEVAHGLLLAPALPALPTPTLPLSAPSGPASSEPAISTSAPFDPDTPWPATSKIARSEPIVTQSASRDSGFSKTSLVRGFVHLLSTVANTLDYHARTSKSKVTKVKKYIERLRDDPQVDGNLLSKRRLNESEYQQLLDSIAEDSDLQSFFDKRFRHEYSHEDHVLVIQIEGSGARHLFLRILGKMDEKQPDRSFTYKDCGFPGLVIEISVSQSVTDVQKKAKAYIQGTEGQIRTVINIDNFSQESLGVIESVISQEFRDKNGQPVSNADLRVSLSDFVSDEVMLPLGEDIPEFVLTSQVLCQVLKSAEEKHQNGEDAKRAGEKRQQKSLRRSERIRNMVKKPSYKV
ncbi:MAG: hypothetical protein Q9157_003800 [Trypethelium eluteriae]